MPPLIRVLIVGAGAREHALAACIARSPRVSAVLALPGNPGIATLARCIPGKVDDIPRIVEVARAEAVDLVVVGPEAPLVAGVGDALRKAGVATFGPDKAAAEIEGSKVFCKDFMKRHGISTAPYRAFDDPDEAERFLRQVGRPLVVKADGLAAGKGVVVSATVEEGVLAVRDIMRRRIFGEAGATVVIEEQLSGEEVSFHAICDGASFVPLTAARDHKRAYDDDRGPNTGGMGAYSPPTVVTEALTARIVEEVVAPTVAGLAAEGRPFRGALFAGIMLGPPDPRGERTVSVLEFNCRFGDPETAVLLARLDSDLVPYLEGAAQGALGSLAQRGLAVSSDPALAVVLAADGYPVAPRVGDPLTGLDQAAAVPGVTLLHGGTAMLGGRLVSSGGRVLCVTARGVDLAEASARAYAATGLIGLAGAHYRRDIGANDSLHAHVVLDPPSVRR